MKKVYIFLGAVVVYIVLFTGLVQASFHKEPTSNDTYEIIQIKQGETLWNIADRYNDERGIPLLKMLEEIRLANDIEGAKIFAGQQLKIPQ